MNPTRSLITLSRAQRARGFGVIAALVVLVMMAVLAAAIVRIGISQQVASTQASNGARAAQLASTMVDYGLYLVFKGTWTTCSNQTYRSTNNNFNGYNTTTCNSVVYNEGETSPGVPRVVRIYTVTTTACSSPTSCPDNAAATKQNYVERVRQAVVVD